MLAIRQPLSFFFQLRLVSIVKRTTHTILLSSSSRVQWTKVCHAAMCNNRCVCVLCARENETKRRSSALMTRASDANSQIVCQRFTSYEQRIMHVTQTREATENRCVRRRHVLTTHFGLSCTISVCVCVYHSKRKCVNMVSDICTRNVKYGHISFAVQVWHEPQLYIVIVVHIGFCIRPIRHDTFVTQHHGWS